MFAPKKCFPTKEPRGATFYPVASISFDRGSNPSIYAMNNCAMNFHWNFSLERSSTGFNYMKRT